MVILNCGKVGTVVFVPFLIKTVVVDDSVEPRFVSSALHIPETVFFDEDFQFDILPEIVKIEMEFKSIVPENWGE